MNEEIEYAEMLEIPVSTVNVVRKKPRRAKKKDVSSAPAAGADLKGAVIAQVNGRLEESAAQQENITAEADLFAESANSAGELRFSETAEDTNADIPERIDTVRLFSTDDRFSGELNSHDFELDPTEGENGVGRYEMNYKKEPSKRVRILLGAEFAAACALCGAIFLTNVFMPGSAINTFFRTLEKGTQTAATDTRTYSDFTLSNVVSDFSEVELNLSSAGILTFQAECCVYPAADGKVSAVTRADDGTYTVRISHSDSFTGVIGGLEYVYYAEGDEVKANVPVGFADGETEVQVTMYSEGELLNCFRLTEENCLAWAEAQ